MSLYEIPFTIAEGITLLYDTVKPLKTATLRGMQNWPSYRGDRLMEPMRIPYLQLTKVKSIK